jgi:CheY-like chemotaxis protein
MPIRDKNTILVVEDDNAVMSAICGLLEFEGYNIIQAGNGSEALDQLRLHGIPDVILLDMKMPVMNGWQFAAEFNARYDHQAPIIVLTAAADAEKRAREIQANAWIPKPFKIEELLSVVKNFIH